MPKKKMTLAELNNQLEKTKTDIRQNENRVKSLLQKENILLRKQRTRRLIERGAILESLIDNAAAFTNDQIKQLLQSALSTEAVREMLHSFISENYQQENETP